jgi:glycosyltransferase
MKILMSTGPSYGLYCPVVPLAWALRSAGHDVVVAAPESLAETVKGSGLPFISTYAPMHMREVMAFDRAGAPVVFAREEEAMLRQCGEGFGRLGARTLDGMLAAADRWRPDVVIGDPHAYSAAITAAVRGVPYVQHEIGLGYRRVIDKWGAVELAAELAALGLDGLPTPGLMLDPCPPDVRGADEPPAEPMRYIQYDPPGTVPAWVLDKHDRPRVMLTLGTVAPAAGGVPVLAQLLRLLPTLGVEVAVAVADDVVDKLGPLPGAVVAAGWLPLASVMPSCDLVVHHSGGGSTMASLKLGLPQVLIPQDIIVENFDSARRLSEYGAAEQILSRPLDPAAVVEACQQLLDDDGYRTRARVLADQIEAMPSPAQVVPVIEEFAASGVAAVAA